MKTECPVCSSTTLQDSTWAPTHATPPIREDLSPKQPESLSEVSSTWCSNINTMRWGTSGHLMAAIWQMWHMSALLRFITSYSNKIRQSVHFIMASLLRLVLYGSVNIDIIICHMCWICIGCQRRDGADTKRQTTSCTHNKKLYQFNRQWFVCHNMILTVSK